MSALQNPPPFYGHHTPRQIRALGFWCSDHARRYVLRDQGYKPLRGAVVWHFRVFRAESSAGASPNE